MVSGINFQFRPFKKIKFQFSGEYLEEIGLFYGLPLVLKKVMIFSVCLLSRN